MGLMVAGAESGLSELSPRDPEPVDAADPDLGGMKGIGAASAKSHTPKDSGPSSSFRTRTNSSIDRRVSLVRKGVSAFMARPNEVRAAIANLRGNGSWPNLALKLFSTLSHGISRSPRGDLRNALWNRSEMTSSSGHRSCSSSPGAGSAPICSTPGEWVRAFGLLSWQTVPIRWSLTSRIQSSGEICAIMNSASNTSNWLSGASLPSATLSSWVHIEGNKAIMPAACQ